MIAVEGWHVCMDACKIIIPGIINHANGMQMAANCFAHSGSSLSMIRSPC